jgi:hypothetical protein
MDFIGLSGILGTIASISTFFIPNSWRSQRLTLVLFVFSIVVLSCIVVNLNSKLERVNRVSLAAAALAEKREMHFTNEGYIQAGLAFLEQNKDLYPDSYKRAILVYDKYKSADHYNNEVISVAFEMDGLIEGIAILNNSNK